MAQQIDGFELERTMQQLNTAGQLGVRADFKPELFDKAIYQKGYRILWEQAMFCSCYRGTSGQPDYNCPSCYGKGYIYFDPKEIRAVVTSINGHKEQINVGLYDMGTAYLTPRSTDNIGFRDRFTFMDFTTKFSEVIVRDSGNQFINTDNLRYKALDMYMVRVLDTVYMRGKDFDLSKDGKQMVWNTNVPSGTMYSVLYSTNPVYVAMGPIHELRGSYSMLKAHGLESFYQFPKQYQIKREDFLTPNE